MEEINEEIKINKVTGERIKLLRARLGLTQPDLGELLSGGDKKAIDGNTISRWESGRQGASKKNLLKLAAFFNTTTSYLLGESDDPTPPMRGVLTANEKLIIEKKDPDWLAAIESDPLKTSSAKLLSELDEDNTRKVWEYIHEKKQLIDLRKEKGA